MKLLAIDCSAGLCAACLHDAAADRELGRAEHLAGVVEEAMERAGLAFSDLGAIAVSVGPGSFTGLRVGVSAARGYALALGIPAIGVTTLEAIAAEARGHAGPVNVLAALDGGRGELQASVYGVQGEALFAPAVITLDQATALAREFSARLAGTAAEQIAAALQASHLVCGPLAATADIGVDARLAAGKKPAEKPKPLYLREPDAKPQAGFILPRTGHGQGG